MLAEMEINKHFSAQRQRAGDKKRASEAGKGSAQKMIMKGMMSKLRVNTVHFLQLSTGQSSTPCALSFICRQRSALHITDDTRDWVFFCFFFSRSLSGWGRHEVNCGYVFDCVLLQQTSSFYSVDDLRLWGMATGWGKIIHHVFLLVTGSVIVACVYLINVWEEMNNMAVLLPPTTGPGGLEKLWTNCGNKSVRMNVIRFEALWGSVSSEGGHRAFERFIDTNHREYCFLGTMC